MTQHSAQSSLTELFMSALNAAEDSGNLEALLTLHAESVTLSNLTEKQWSGLQGAREFWEQYLGNFDKIHSHFSHYTSSGALGVMEWTGKGELKDGSPIEYRGMSIIEHSGGKVTAFRTYYDSAAFIKPV